MSEIIVVQSNDIFYQKTAQSKISSSKRDFY